MLTRVKPCQRRGPTCQQSAGAESNKRRKPEHGASTGNGARDRGRTWPAPTLRYSLPGAGVRPGALLQRGRSTGRRGAAQESGPMARCRAGKRTGARADTQESGPLSTAGAGAYLPGACGGPDAGAERSNRGSPTRSNREGRGASNREDPGGEQEPLCQLGRCTGPSRARHSMARRCTETRKPGRSPTRADGSPEPFCGGAQEARDPCFPSGRKPGAEQARKEGVVSVVLFNSVRGRPGVPAASS